MNNNAFDEYYYKSVNYTDYTERRERYIMTARNMIGALEVFSCLKKDSKILDFGCAVGFLMEGFLNYGYDIDGYDISEWAVSQAKAKGLSIIDHVCKGYDLLISLDVFEHMTDKDIVQALLGTQAPLMVVRIPCAEEGENQFHLEVSRRDPTHINCKTKAAWKDFFKQFGYETSLILNLDTIYDSPGVFCSLFIKKDRNV